MPIDCGASFAATGIPSTDGLTTLGCGKVIFCLVDTDTSRYFGQFGVLGFGTGTSPNNYAQDPILANEFEDGTAQCFILEYEPSGSETTDTLTIQGTNADNSPSGPPCVFTFDVPEPCTTTGNPPCPNPPGNFSYDLANPTGSITRDIVSDLGFPATCTLVSAQDTTGVLAPIGVSGTTMTITQNALSGAGVGTHSIAYEVDCGGATNVICDISVTVVNNTTTLACPSPAVSINYDLARTDNLVITNTDLGFGSNCVIQSVVSGVLSVSLSNGNTAITIPASNLDIQSTGQYSISYAIECNGESVQCDFVVQVTEANTGDPCVVCSSMQVDFNSVPTALNSTVNVTCGSGPIPIRLTIPNPSGNNLGYYFPNSSAGSFSFVSSEPPVGGFQVQTWSLTPKTSGCSETIPVVMNWLSTEAQSGCPNCTLFNIIVSDCADCTGTGCTKTATCIITEADVAEGQTFTLSSTGCDCTGCQVTWVNAATNPTVINLPNPTGNTITAVFPAGVPQGSYTFEPQCCGCV